MNYGEMKKQNWALNNEAQFIVEYDDFDAPGGVHRSPVDNNDDDDDDVQLGNNSFYNRHTIRASYPDDDEDEPTLKSARTFKTEKQTMIERKKLEADARAQVLT